MDWAAQTDTDRAAGMEAKVRELLAWQEEQAEEHAEEEEAEQQGKEQEGKDLDEEAEEFVCRLLAEGAHTPGDTGAPMDNRPAWLQPALFERGQQFAQEFFFGLMFAEVLSLPLLLALPGSRQPLIFSDNSDTPFKAFRRYLSTVARVRSWYRGDPWQPGDSARRHVKVVRALHQRYRQQLSAAAAADPDQLEPRLSLAGPLWLDGAAQAVNADCAALEPVCPCTGLALGLLQPASPLESRQWLNQAEMSVTQFGFVALVTLYPDRFGAAAASDADLEGFLHLWRALGRQLGVRERFNFCSGGLQTVRARSRALLRLLLLPALARAGPDWEHLLRCLVAGVRLYVPAMHFEASLMYLCDALEVPCPRLRSRATLRARLLYWLYYIVLRWGLRLCWLRERLTRALNRSIERALAAPASWLRLQQQRSYGYEQDNGLAETLPPLPQEAQQ